MFEDKITEELKGLIAPYIHEGDIAVDLTAGNGYDTLFLSEKVGELGHVYAFDIQEQAIRNTQQLLQDQSIHKQNVSLIQDSHDQVQKYVPANISIAMMNLGYLPSGDKSIVTKPETTILALKDTLKLLKFQGVISIVVYYGHCGGQEEKSILKTFIESLDEKYYNARTITYSNRKNNPPIIHILQKK